MPAVRSVMARANESADAYAVFVCVCTTMDPMCRVDIDRALYLYSSVNGGSLEQFETAGNWLVKYGFLKRDGSGLAVQDPIEVIRRDDFFYNGMVESFLELLDSDAARQKVAAREQQRSRREKWRQEQPWNRFRSSRRRDK
ncbi:hypothetical protein [Bosea sp. RAC05]|uniref:hypothetical protein n=1 Tax=Bosea sp. RAC05 TaxID=1842539 RepID=UPI00085813EE|nr:hypothetical protein [Bosea sp. RAC05]AOG03137.1 hypothetical protein BSY19_5085 [Bosea sp. RAC05]